MRNALRRFLPGAAALGAALILGAWAPNDSPVADAAMRRLLKPVNLTR